MQILRIFWEILAWPAFPGNYFSGIFRIFRTLELILRIPIIPIGIIPVPRINSKNSNISIGIILIRRINSKNSNNSNWNYSNC